MKTFTSRTRSCVMFLVLLVATPIWVSSEAVDEYAVKAAFLLNFTKFVEWPADSRSSAFTMCVLEDDPFGSTIDRVTEGKTTMGKPIQIRRIKDLADTRLCQIAFVGSLERRKEAKLIQATRGMAILTVGETEEFLRTGGMIYLAMEQSRVSIVVNPAAAAGANLKISAKLLALATIFKNEPGVTK